jgi:hypothetical protein
MPIVIPRMQRPNLVIFIDILMASEYYNDAQKYP